MKDRCQNYDLRNKHGYILLKSNFRGDIENAAVLSLSFPPQNVKSAVS